MNFYRLTESANLKEIGVYPQINTYDNHTLSLSELQFIDSLHPFKKLLDNLILPHNILRKKAKLTDLISYGNNFGKLISEKLSDIIMPYNNNNFQCIDVKVLQNTKAFNYKILHPYNYKYSFVNFKKSTVIEREGLWGEGKQINIENEAAFFRAISTLDRSKSINILLPVFYTENIDHIFTLQYVDGSGTEYYISEELREKIEAAQCTGIRFLNLDEKL